MIIYEYPPFYEEVVKAFGPQPYAVFAYSPDMYIPSKIEPDKPIIEHEKVHFSQQERLGRDNWWKMYLNDKDFRLAMEIPAYQVQVREAKKLIKDRNRLYSYTQALAKDLSGKMYGEIISFSDAMKAIQREKLYDFKI